MAESADGAVRKLRSDVARQISTGQVIVSLMGACRELIDNALDAGASTVEVRLKEHGADALEVSDNGHGISSENFSSLGKPHATSKLTDFNDFNSLLTFGFRGEALNALCALGNVTITTRHKLAKLGTKLTFSPTGEIFSQTVATRPIGTTVCVEKLFHALPVRRKEFVKNAKREMHRLLGAVQAFALSRTDVRFTVSNGNGVKSFQILNSPGNNSPVMQVMTSLFGASVSKKSLIPIKSAEPDEKCLEIYELPNDEAVKKECEQITLTGYVSNCEAGNGRHVSDRQFVFINKRPVDHAKLCKIANELYNVFNKNSYCILVLFIEVDPSQLDVNVTPDKRIVYLRNEKELYAKFRASLLATFESVAGKNTVARETLPTQSQMFTAKDFPANDSRTDEYDLYGSPASSPRPEPVNISGMLRNEREEKGKRGKEKQRKERSEKGPPPLKRPCTMDSFVNRLSKMEDVVSSPRLTQTVQLQSRLNADDFHSEIDRSFLANSTALDEVINLENDGEFNSNRISGGDQGEVRGLTEETLSQDSRNDTTFEDIPVGSGLKLIPILSMPPEENSKNFDEDCVDGEDNDDQRDEEGFLGLSEEDYVPLWREIEESDVRSEVFSYNFRSQKTQNNLEEEHEKCCEESTSDLDVISNTDFDEPPEKAEEKLNLMLKAENFAEMVVIGQYNNAFILARHGQEIFLIDQHAADEKYNFEWLQKNAKVKSQGVCDQRQMSLGPVEEAVLISHLDILAASGFEFEVNEQAPSGQRVLLASVPTVCGWHFDASDIEECISALRQFPSTMYRPVKLRKIFASKACRKSVMFGDTLSMEKMVKIVRHMGAMEQPWNCPHGRPTIRHVCTLKDQIEAPLSECDEQEESSQETDITFDISMDEETFEKENLNETQYEGEI